MRRAVIALAVAVCALAFAHAGSAATYTVCGVSQEVQEQGGLRLIPLAPGVASGCMSMPDAIAAARATPEADTIRMLPGTYCPIDLEGTFAQPVTFVGVGMAAVAPGGLGTPVNQAISEASLSTVEDEHAFCAFSFELVDMNATVTSNAPMVFQNVALNGINGQSANAGFSQNDVATNTVLRDDILENLTVGDSGAGIAFIGPSGSLDVENSAVVDNGFGVWYRDFATGSISDSTISGNGTGLRFEDSTVTVASDTVSHNYEGIDVVGPPPGTRVVDTIVAGNIIEDCLDVSAWETAGPSGGNLLGDNFCPHGAPGDIVDVNLTQQPGEMPGLANNGGPTPSIIPVQARGLDPAGACGVGGVDQREYTVDESLPCDVGAVQSFFTAASTDANDVNFGPVPFDSSTSGTVTLSTTSGLIGTAGVSISGTGWSVSDDGCTFTLVESSSDAPTRSCSVEVTLHTTSVRTDWHGTLTLHTTVGDVVADLDAQTPGPPSISSFTPSGGTSPTGVTITGAHFTDASSVSIGATPASSFTVVSDTEIDAVIGGGTTSGLIRVTTPVGAGTSSRTFVLSRPPPLVRAFAPGQGLVGASVTITGVHFTGATGVNFGGTPAVTFSVASDTSITAFVPASATSGRVTVNGPGGTSAGVPVFTVLPAVALAPTLTSVSPGSGARGVRVTIRGSGLTGATQVTFNGKSAVFTVVNDSMITAIVPAGATSGHIRVTTPGGTATSAATFTVL